MNTQRKSAVDFIPSKAYNNHGDMMGLQERSAYFQMMETSEKKNVRAYLVDDRGTWTVVARVYDPKTGKTRKRSKTTGVKVRADGRGKRAAENIMRELQTKWEQQANEFISEDNPLFSEYVDRFITRKAISKEKNTIQSYRGYAKNPILPFFGDIRIQEIRRRHLEVFLAEMLKTRSVSTVKKYFVVINGALQEAKRDSVIDRNFWDDVEFPKMQKFEKKILTPEQVITLLEALKDEGEPMLSAVILGVCYGLRREEVCGLRWQDIDFQGKTLIIRNTVTQNGGLILERMRTKTDASHRQIGLLDNTIPYLQQLKQTQKAAALTLDKVCRWPNGKEVQPSYITHRFPKLLEKYNLPDVRFHDLRHTAASMLLSKLSAFQAKEFLGHEDIATTTNIYGSLLDSGRTETANVMNDFYNGVAFCSERCSESADGDGHKAENCGEKL